MTKITQQISYATMQIKKGQETKLHKKIFLLQKDESLSTTVHLNFKWLNVKTTFKSHLISQISGFDGYPRHTQPPFHH